MSDFPLPPGVADLEDEPTDEAPDFLTIPQDGQDSAVDEGVQRRKRRRAQRKMSEKEQFWHGVLSLDTGRAVLWEWLVACRTFDYPSGVTPAGVPDPSALMFHLGKQSVGRALYDMLAALDRPLVLLMHDEHDPTYQTIAKTKGYR